MSSRPQESWMDGIIGPDTIKVDGEPITVARPHINLVGATQEDDPDNDATNITIEGMGGSTPGGSDGDLQRNSSGALAPVRTSANGAPASGDIARYDGSKWIAADDAVELPDPLTVGDLLVWNGSALIVIPAGTEGQVLTMVGGMPAWGDGGPAPFDIESLSWSGDWEVYTSVPWSGIASAGASSGRLLSAGSAPAAGSDGGFAHAAFNGSSNYLDTPLSTGSFFTQTAYSVVLLVKLKSPAAPAGNVYDNEHIVSSTPFGQFGICWSTSGVKAWHAEAGPTYKETNWLACSSGSWVMIAAVFDGASLSIDVNESGSPETVASTSNDFVALGALPIRLGGNYAPGVFTEMDVRRVLFAPTALSSGDLADIKSAFNDIFGLSL